MPTIETPRGALAYTDHGGDGIPVVALHGFFMDQSMFNPQVEGLADVARVITVDIYGHGGSSDGPVGFTYWDVADDVVALLDHLAIDEAVWLGMSQGGYAALRGALAHPERVSGLILVSTETAATDAETKAEYEGLFSFWAASGPNQPILQGLAGQLLGAEEHWGSWPDRWAVTPWSRIEAVSHALLNRDDITAEAKSIAIPSIVIGGTEDRAIPVEKTHRLAETLDSPHVLAVEGAAHAVNLTHPEPVNAAIREYLAELS